MHSTTAHHSETDILLARPMAYHLQELLTACVTLQEAFNQKQASWDQLSPSQRQKLDAELRASVKRAERACFYIGQKLPPHSSGALRWDALGEIYAAIVDDGELFGLEQAMSYLARYCLRDPINPR